MEITPSQIIGYSNVQSNGEILKNNARETTRRFKVGEQDKRQIAMETRK